ncbi:MAG: hypothetical protein IPO22_15680 [Anaerolineales bacterium]|nr:hypothetical protein [Anaerolineales bacterium]
MKLSTNTIIAFFGTLIVGMLALITVGVLAMPILQADQPEPMDTQATLQAMVTQTVFALTQNAPTQTPPPPTLTAVPVTNTPVPTSTPIPPVTYCDWVAFVKDVNFPDGSVVAPGETFTKIWRLKNRGTCTWTSDYMLVFTSGTQMGSTTAVRLPGTVLPGQNVDVSVTLTAPTGSGPYTSNWMLRNPSGALFGMGDKANVAFYVDVQVKQPVTDLPHGTVTGSLCYPSEFNPPMTLYFERLDTADRIQFSMVEAQNTYSVLLPKGYYYVYAWAPNYNLEGAYANPTTNLMIPVFVSGGQTTSAIDLCNWSPYPHGRGK